MQNSSHFYTHSQMLHKVSVLVLLISECEKICYMYLTTIDCKNVLELNLLCS